MGNSESLLAIEDITDRDITEKVAVSEYAARRYNSNASRNFDSNPTTQLGYVRYSFNRAQRLKNDWIKVSVISDSFRSQQKNIENKLLTDLLCHVSYSIPVKLDPPMLKKLDRLGDEFMANSLRYEVDRRDNVPAMFELGTVLTRLRRFQEGLEIDRRLVRLQPDQPVLRYNLACSLALVEMNDEAVSELTKAIDLGYDDVDHMLKDRDLEILRRDERFADLVRRLRDQERTESELTEESD